MRASDFLALKTYVVKIRIPSPSGNKTPVDTTVQARNPEMARRILRHQYGDSNVVIGQPRLLK